MIAVNTADHVKHALPLHIPFSKKFIQHANYLTHPRALRFYVGRGGKGWGGIIASTGFGTRSLVSAANIIIAATKASQKPKDRYDE
jgi:hypothetical protein